MRDSWALKKIDFCDGSQREIGVKQSENMKRISGKENKIKGTEIANNMDCYLLCFYCASSTKLGALHT